MNTTKHYRTLGLLGGTFDPIHNGHLAIAQAALNTCELDRIEFIPNKQPVCDKTAKATAAQRLAMLNLAIADEKNYAVNTLEIDSPQPSYTLTSLQQLRRSYPDYSLCFIIGMDAFNTLNTWQGYQEILGLCHLIVVNRNDLPLNAIDWLKNEPGFIISDTIGALHQQRHGKIFQLDINPIDMSATDIRQKIAQGEAINNCVTKKVQQYIQQQQLYR